MSNRQIKKGTLFLQLGDRIVGIQYSPNFPIIYPEIMTFTKNSQETFFFSDSFARVLQGVSLNNSSVGDICYFPNLRQLGICLQEDDSLDSPRILLGKIKGNLFYIEGLSAVVEGRIFWVFEFTRKEDEIP